MSGGGILVGGEPMALLAASSAVHEVASRTGDVGLRLVQALASTRTTILVAAPFAPGAAAAALGALGNVMVGPASGLATVRIALQALSIELRQAGQALEAAGAAGLLATGGLALLRGERPTVLASADGVDLRREAFTASWSTYGHGGSSSLGVREVEVGDGSTIFVVEATMSVREAQSAGIQVNGAGLFAEGGSSSDVTLRWAVPTEHDARLMVAAASAVLVPQVGKLARSHLPRPTEVTTAAAVSGTLVGGAASGTAGVRGEVTTLASGAQRYSAAVGAVGTTGLAGLAGTGGSASAKVTVDRSPAGTVTGISLTSSTEVDQGRHGNPLLEAGNREATLVERTHAIVLTPERRAAADRVAAAIARGEAPERSDVDLLARVGQDAEVQEHTYDVRHQLASFDVSVKAADGGAGVAVDTATLRK